MLRHLKHPTRRQLTLTKPDACPLHGVQGVDFDHPQPDACRRPLATCYACAIPVRRYEARSSAVGVGDQVMIVGVIESRLICGPGIMTGRSQPARYLHRHAVIDDEAQPMSPDCRFVHCSRYIPPCEARVVGEDPLDRPPGAVQPPDRGDRNARPCEDLC